MAVNAKAVVSVDVDDKRFKAFMQEFDKFNKLLGRSPAAWKAMSQSQREMVQSFNQGIAALMAQNEVMRKMSIHAKDVHSNFREAKKHVSEMGERVKKVGEGIIGITEKLMKWGSIAAGLVTGTTLAGFFGLDRMGDWVRRGSISSGGVGMKSGELRALEQGFTDYGMDVKGAARASSQAAGDPASEAAFAYTSLGLNPRSLHGTKRLTAVTDAIRSRFKSSGMSPEMFAEYHGLQGLGIDSSQVRLITKDTDAQYEYRKKGIEADADRMGISDEAETKWKKFMHALESATTQLQAILGEALTPILEAFTKHSQGWIDSIRTFMTSKEVKQFLEDLPKHAETMWEWFGKIAGYLKSFGQAIGWIDTPTKDKEGKVIPHVPWQVEWGFRAPTAEEQPGVDAEMKRRWERTKGWGKGALDWLGSGYDSVMGGTAYDVRTHAKTIGKLSDESGTTAFFEQMGKSMWKGWMEGMQYFGTIGKTDLGSHQSGTDLSGVPETGSYTIHKGEVVLPRNQVEILRASGMADWKRAISGVESGGRYGAMGPWTGGDQAHGKYQVMGNNIGAWTKKALGYSMTRQEFLASPQAQERVFETIFGDYVSKYGNPLDAASAWFSGGPFAGNKAGPDVLGTTVPGYIKKFIGALTGGGGGHMNLNINDNTGGNVAISATNLATTGPLPMFPL